VRSEKTTVVATKQAKEHHPTSRAVNQLIDQKLILEEIVFN
jgi:hypothetical protein